MPDFDALIRHQQLKQSPANQRLKVVESPDFEKEKNREPFLKKNSLLGHFFWSFLGSIIGTLSILFLYINNYLPLDLIKLK